MKPFADLAYLEWTTVDGTLKRLYPDTVEEESPDLPAIVSTHPVETGGKITDNYRPDAETLSLTMVFSDTPIRNDLPYDGSTAAVYRTLQTKPLDLHEEQRDPVSPFTPGGATSAIVGGIGSLLGMQPDGIPDKMEVLTFDEPPNRSQQVFDAIQEIRNQGLLITVSSLLAVWDNMAIVNAKPVPLFGALRLQLDMQRLKFVTAEQTIAIPIPDEPRAQKKKAGANGNTTPVPEGGSGASLLKGLGNSAGVTAPGSGL